MPHDRHRYRYVGPAEIAQAVRGQAAGRVVDGIAALEAALEVLDAEDGAPMTYVVDLQGRLRLADRSSEHVACAGGADMLAAGEIAFEEAGDGWRASYSSNQSTGFCPEPSCWEALADALDTIGVAHEGRFTNEMIFRRCDECGERNLVKDHDYHCYVCGAELSEHWNVSQV